VSIAAAVATIGASIVLVLRLGPIGVPLGQLAGASVVLPFLVAGLGAGGTRRVVAAAATALAPMTAALLVGLVAARAPLDPGARGLVTAGVSTLVYVATAWWAGPRWLRDAARDELARFY
jgi:hypothetical protein